MSEQRKEQYSRVPAMNEANHISGKSRGDPQKTIHDLCHDLKILQEGQAQLIEQMENFTFTLNALFDVQKELNTHIATLAERYFEQRSTTGPCNVHTEETDAIADAGMPTAPYPQFDAGLRLTNTSELLEVILLELPSENLLSAQRISRQFRSIIVGSHLLQLRLFLTTQPTTSISKDIILNPIITKEQSLPHIPLYFDDKRMTMAYCHREGRKRVYCKTAAIGKDDVTRQEWVDLHHTNSFIPRTGWGFPSEARQGPFDAGSWKQMCLCQPPCEVKWRLTIVEDNTEHRYSGTVASESTMDAFLEAFAAAVVVDEGEHRRSRRR